MYSVVLFVCCDMSDDDEEYESVHLFASYEPYELMVGLFLPGHHTGKRGTYILDLLRTYVLCGIKLRHLTLISTFIYIL